MSLTPRRTVRISDAQWDAGHAKAQSEGDNLTNVLRKLLEGYLAGHRIEYRAKSKHLVNGEHHVVSGLVGEFDDITRLYPPSRWVIEEYDVSPPRPVKRKSGS